MCVCVCVCVCLFIFLQSTDSDHGRKTSPGSKSDRSAELGKGEKDKPMGMTHYTLKISTGSCAFGGTNAQAHVEIIGRKRSARPRGEKGKRFT